jgi:hypothetical protein
MKSALFAGVALATVIASPAFAAAGHRAAEARDTLPYGQIGAQNYARQPDVVTFGSRIVGEDPDANIRGQLLHDPVVSEN